MSQTSYYGPVQGPTALATLEAHKLSRELRITRSGCGGLQFGVLGDGDAMALAMSHSRARLVER